MSRNVQDTNGDRANGLIVRGASVPFGTRDGLHDIDLTVAPGERVALLGPSGAGKTTLLRAIAGLEPMTAGSLHVGGTDVTHALPERRGVVYLHQTPMLFPHLSVEDNVGFPLEVRGATRADARRRAGELLDRVQLSNLAHRSAGALSGGQRHRVALARALAANPAVLLLDEPFNALDPALRADVRDAVFTMLHHARGPSVVIVTHDVDEAASLAGRMAVLLEGQIAQDATPADIMTRPASVAVARFLGLPNIVPGVCDGAGTFQCALGDFASTLGAGPAALVSRPDGFVVHLAAPPGGEAFAGEVTSVRERVSGSLAVVRIDDRAAVQVIAALGDTSARAGDRVWVSVSRTRAQVVPVTAPRSTAAAMSPARPTATER